MLFMNSVMPWLRFYILNAETAQMCEPRSIVTVNIFAQNRVQCLCEL